MWLNSDKIFSSVPVLILLATVCQASDEVLHRQRRVLAYPYNSCTGVSDLCVWRKGFNCSNYDINSSAGAGRNFGSPGTRTQECLCLVQLRGQLQYANFCSWPSAWSPKKTRPGWQRSVVQGEWHKCHQRCDHPWTTHIYIQIEDLQLNREQDQWVNENWFGSVDVNVISILNLLQAQLKWEQVSPATDMRSS